MTKKAIICSLLAGFLLSASDGRAVQSGATFLKISPSARVAGLGGAFCGLADDVNGLGLNPGGLSQIKGNEFAATHLNWFQGVKYEHLSYVQPIKNTTLFGIKDWAAFKQCKQPGAMAMSLGFLSIDNLKEYTANKEYKAAFEAKDLVLTIGYAKTLKENLSAGASLKYINQSIKNKQATGIAFDAGALYKPQVKGLTIGMALQNIGTKIGFGGSKDALPLSLRLGGSYKLFNDTLILALDINLPKDSAGTKLHLGSEYLYPIYQDVKLTLRAGYKQGMDLGDLSFGLGVNWQGLQCDYAFMPYEDLGNTHHLSLGIRFGAVEKGSETKEASIETKGKQSTIPTDKKEELTPAPSSKDKVIEFEEESPVESTETEPVEPAQPEPVKSNESKPEPGISEQKIETQGGAKQSDEQTPSTPLNPAVPSKPSQGGAKQSDEQTPSTSPSPAAPSNNAPIPTSDTPSNPSQGGAKNIDEASGSGANVAQSQERVRLLKSVTPPSPPLAGFEPVAAPMAE